MEVPPDGLIARLLDSEIAYTAARAAVIGRWPGNPFGVAAGNCVLFVHDRIAYVADMATRVEHRGHGMQTALLAACHARAAGAEVMWARCRFLSQSHRNLQRGGLRTLCTTAFWH